MYKQRQCEIILQVVALFHFLSSFEKLRKADISYFISACPSVRSHGKTRLPLDGFS